MAHHLKRSVDDFQPLLKLESHLEQRKMMQLQKTAKERKERRSDKAQFVIMALIPCQVSFNMKERAHSIFRERTEHGKEEKKKEERKKKKNERIRRELT